MAVKLARWRIRRLDIPLGRTFHWAGHSEDRIDVLLLEAECAGGLRGVAEMAVRPKWHGETFADISAAISGRIMPALMDMDLRDCGLFQARLASSADSPLARALVDMARADIVAQAQGVSLAGFLARSFGETTGNGQPECAAFSCTVTRAPPDAMAREAADLRAATGARAFKIKTGQGIDVDANAVAGIRAIAGEDAVLSADSNSAGPPESVRAMADMLARNGVEWFEDPCRLYADASFAEVRAASRVPVLVDNACRNQAAARAFLALGAEGLSIKLMKTGIGVSIEILQLAAASGARATIGICASTSLSAIHSLSLFAAMPAAWRAMPCEETFFVNLPRDLLVEPLAFADGAVGLPLAGPFADLLDWPAIERLTVASGTCN